MQSATMRTVSLLNLQRHARWITICILGLAALTIVGRSPLIKQLPEPVAVPDFVRLKQFTESIPVQSKVNLNDYPDNNMTSMKMSELKTELEIRRKRVDDICQIIENETSSFHTAMSKLIIDTNHGLSWCPIYKVGSSTWMEHFAVLGRTFSDLTVDLIRRNILQVNIIARQAFPNYDVETMLEKIKRTKKFLIVRHPFERILSAYRDKLENIDGREYYYKKFGRHITQRYRHKNASLDTRIEPSFTEFLRFIVEEKYFDEHWAPYTQTCRPCELKYDYILKFETFKRDEDFLIQELGLNKYLHTRGDVRHVNPRGPTTAMTSRKYFKNVPELLIKKVHQVYEKDFKLFNYSPADYYGLTTKQP